MLSVLRIVQRRDAKKRAQHLKHGLQRRRMSEHGSSRFQDVKVSLAAAPFAEFVAEPALAHAGRRCNADHARFALLRLPERALKDSEFVVTAIQSGQFGAAELLASNCRLHPEQAMHLNRL